MNTPNPLIPQGSLEAQQYKKRSTTKIFVSIIISGHIVVLGGLLFLGCEKEPGTKDLAARKATNQFTELDRTSTNAGPFGDLPLDATNDIQIPKIPVDTNHMLGFSQPRGDGGFGTLTNNPPFPGGAGLTATNIAGGFQMATNQAESGGQLVDQSQAEASTKYAVLPGDTLSGIAKRHHITLKALMAANPNVEPRKMKVGDPLNLPNNVKPATPNVPEPGAGAAAANESTYKVKSGDTLYDLAKRFHVKVKDLQRANGIIGSGIRVGQQLIIPGGAKTGTNQ